MKRNNFRVNQQAITNCQPFRQIDYENPHYFIGANMKPQFHENQRDFNQPYFQNYIAHEYRHYPAGY